MSNAWVALATKALSEDADDLTWFAETKAERDVRMGQFVFLAKPELLDLRSGVRVRHVLQSVSEMLALHEVSVTGGRLYSGAALEDGNIIASHYGVINRISRVGQAALSSEANDVLRTAFSADIRRGMSVLGGHQALAQFPDLDAESLQALFQRSSVVRLGAGAYASRVLIRGQGVLVLNGFHPKQLQHFTRERAYTLALEVTSATPWAALRQKLIGGTDPKDAPSASLRGMLYRKAPSYGIPIISQNLNGVHLSAGPIEGMVEMVRFFDRIGGVEDTHFGQMCLRAGMDISMVRLLADNPSIDWDGRAVTLFDATEEMEPEQALRLVCDSSICSALRDGE